MNRAKSARKAVLSLLATACIAAMPVWGHAATAYPSNLYDSLQWRLVGPFRGGRTVTATGIPNDPLTYYFGAVAGGVWKTIDGGTTWKPIFDKEPEASIGVVAVAPSDPNVIYVGTGERDLRNDYSSGGGVYKSVDAGKTWTFIGLKETRQIASIIIDKHDPNNVYLAAVGHASGPNKERGVYHTTDGGQTWKNILFVNDKTGAIDLKADPTNPQVMFASMYEVRRDIYAMVSGGPGSALYKTVDGGASWKKVEGHGMPEGMLGRIGISISGANHNRIYAQIETKGDDAIYTSADGGDSWTAVNHDPAWVRPWYQNEIFADPKEENRLYVLNVGTFLSTDGGKTFQHLDVSHTDEHDLWIDPNNNMRMIEANDGGVQISLDKGVTWSLPNNQPTAQFYHVATSNEFNYMIYGAQQDSGTVAIRSRTDHGSIGEGDWHAVGGGESGYIFPDPRDPAIVYAGSNNGRITRLDEHTGQTYNISPTFGGRTHQASELVHRFQWTSPLMISPHDPDTIYYGGEVLFRTRDGGASWDIVSPDLTRNDKSKQQSQPEPLTPDNSSSEYYDTIWAIAESPVQKDMIWTGSDDGLVHLTRDGGKHWDDVTPKALPEWSRVDMIEASPWDAATAYMAADLHYKDDSRPMIFKTVDAGKTWMPIASGIPADDYVHSIHTDPVRKGLLYAGTERGLYVSFDDGANWQPMQMNLPPAPIYDTGIHGDDLIAATHGRAFWVLNDIAPIRQADPAIASKPAYLYAPAVAYRGRGGRGEGERNAAPNPPAGAAIDYYLAQPGPVELDITDPAGMTVYHGENEPQAGGKPDRGGPPVHAGLNRYLWNLRLRGLRALPGLVSQEMNGAGPLVPPGTYTVKLTAGGQTFTQALTVRADPRLKVAQADFDKQYQFAVKLRDRVLEANDIVREIREMRPKLDDLKKSRPADAKKIDALEKTMTGVEEDLVQVKSVDRWSDLVFSIRLAAQYADLMNAVESADTAPPAQTYTFFDMYEKKRADIMERWESAEKGLAAFNIEPSHEKHAELADADEPTETEVAEDDD